MPGHNVALSECQIDVLAIDGRSVEIVRAAPEIREFPARVSEGLGICLKLGDAHDVMINGRRATYPAGSVSVRMPGCVWASEVGCHGFVSVDVDTALLPVEFSGKEMDFFAPTQIPRPREKRAGVAGPEGRIRRGGGAYRACRLRDAAQLIR